MSFAWRLLVAAPEFQVQITLALLHAIAWQLAVRRLALQPSCNPAATPRATPCGALTLPLTLALTLTQVRHLQRVQHPLGQGAGRHDQEPRGAPCGQARLGRPARDCVRGAAPELGARVRRHASRRHATPAARRALYCLVGTAPGSQPHHACVHTRLRPHTPCAPAATPGARGP